MGSKATLRNERRIRMWTVYAVECRDGSIYTGATTDVRRRLREHNAGQGGAYTRSRRPVRLIFKEAHPSQSSALKREAQVKGWPHSKKKLLWYHDGHDPTP